MMLQSRPVAEVHSKHLLFDHEQKGKLRSECFYCIFHPQLSSNSKWGRSITIGAALDQQRVVYYLVCQLPCLSFKFQMNRFSAIAL